MSKSTRFTWQMNDCLCTKLHREAWFCTIASLLCGGKVYPHGLSRASLKSGQGLISSSLSAYISHFLYVFRFAKLKFRTFFHIKASSVHEDLFSVVLNLIRIYVRVVLPSGVFVAFVTIGSINGNRRYLLCPNSV